MVCGPYHISVETGILAAHPFLSLHSVKRGLAENKVWPTLRAPLSGAVVNQCLEFGSGPAGQSSDTPADLAEHLSNLRELSVSVGKL